MEPNKQLRRRKKLGLSRFLPSRSQGSSPSPHIPASTATTSSHLSKTTSSASAHGEESATTVGMQSSTTTAPSLQHPAQATTASNVATSVGTDRTPTPPERLWDRAYDDLKKEEAELLQAYEKILSYNLREDGIGSEISESQPNAIVQHDADQRRDQMMQLVNNGVNKTAREAKIKSHFDSAAKIVQHIKDIISPAIQVVPQAALPWAGVCVALQIILYPIQGITINRDGIFYVIQQMDWYWNLSSSLFDDGIDKLAGLRHELENQIVALYKKLLLYQIKSVCYCYRHRGLVFLRDIVKLDDWDCDLKAIRDAETCFRQSSEGYDTQRTNYHLKQTNSHLEQLVMNQRSEEDQQCLKDLRITDPRDDKTRIEQTKGGLLLDTYRWILDNIKLQQWRDDPKSSLLCIKADPGKGKTMLLCGIVDELRKSTYPRLLSFFFCQATDERLRSASAVLRGLMYLLIQQQPSLISHIRKKYDDAGKSLFNDPNSWIAMSDIFKNMIADPKLETTYVIIDALDECITDRSKLLDFIINISSSSPGVKWLLSSRNEPDIEHRLKSTDEQRTLCLELRENAEHVSRAIDAYIDHKLSCLESFQDYALRDRVGDILRQKANGTFLWVALVVQELGQSQSWNPLQVVEEVPEGLHPLYDRMVGQIQQQLKKSNSQLCRLILSITTVAYRPLCLAEIGSLCGLPGEISLSTKNMRKIMTMCGSFLAVQEDHVYLIHQSAKDYLSNRMRATIFPSQEKTHHDIFLRSLELMTTILRRDMYGLIAPGCSIDQIQVPDPNPLRAIRYSCAHWINHLIDSVSSKDTRPEAALEDGGITYVFLRDEYLYWLEALSLCKSMSEGVVLMAKLEALVQGKAEATTLIELIRDARRFIMYHKWAIENSPLQAYASALVFSPTASLVRRLFKKEEPKWITIQPTMRDRWGECLQTLEGHSNRVRSVAFSHDSTRLASASWDSTVKIWDASSGECLQTLEGHSGRVQSVAFSHDSTQLASASGDSTVKIWDTSSGKCLQTLEGHSGRLQSVTFSHDSTQLASASGDSTVKIWDTSSGECLQTLEGHSGGVESVTFSHDSTRLVSASGDSTVKIWDVSSGECLQTLEGRSGGVESVTFSHDSTRLASASWDSTVKIWDASSGEYLQTLEGHSGGVESVTFSHDSTRLASASWDSTVKIWDASSGEYLQTLEGHSDGVESVAFSHDSTRLASASGDSTVKIWDPSSGEYLQTLEGHSDGVESVAFSHDSTRLASASWDSTVKIWDASSGEYLQTLEGHSDGVESVAFSHDSTRLASASWDSTVKIWDASSGKCLQTLEGHSGRVGSVIFSHDSTRLASASWDSTVKIWDTSSGECLQTLEGHSNRVRSVAFSHDSTRLASASGDSTVKIWDASSGEYLQTLEGHSDGVESVAFSHDSTRLASASGDSTVKIWDASSGQCLQSFNTGGACHDISFNSTGSCLYTNRGIIIIDPDLLLGSNDPQNPRWQGLGLSSDAVWITNNSENQVWLPSEYRPSSSAVSGDKIGVGTGSGKIWIWKSKLPAA